MESKARIGSHSLHSKLVAVPIVLWILSWFADVFYMLGMNSNWKFVAAYCLSGGCIGGVLAALPGLIEYAFITNPRAKRIAAWFMMINFSLVLLFSFNFLIRSGHFYEMQGIPFALSSFGIFFLCVSGWMGGELVYSYRIDVSEETSVRTIRRGVCDKDQSEDEAYSRVLASN